jgi:hypothetical protein
MAGRQDRPASLAILAQQRQNPGGLEAEPPCQKMTPSSALFLNLSIIPQNTGSLELQ